MEKTKPKTTNEEFAKSHVEEALNIPGRVINPDFLSQVASVCKKDKHLIVACNAGGSRACVDLLNEEQIKDQVVNIALRRHVGILHVKVVKAVVQRKKVQMGMINPYVQIELSEDKISSKKTTVKHKNLNPEWNEEFKFSVRDPKTQVLEFNVYGWEKIGKHDKMGMNVLALKELAPDERKAFTLELRKTLDGGEEGQPGKYRGKLEVELLYKPFTEEEMQAVQKAPEGTPVAGGMLVVIVHLAEDVEGKHHTNPYVHIYFKGEERKTKNVKKNKDPKWNEEFSFILEETPIHEKMHVEVLSTSSRIGLLHPKETLGYVDIPVVDVVNNKRMNQKFHLIDSKNGKIQIELEWQTAF